MAPTAKTIIKVTTAFGVAVGASFAWKNLTSDAPAPDNGEITTPVANEVNTKPVTNEVSTPSQVQKITPATPEKAGAQPELSKASIAMINHYGIHQDHLQFDKVRERDKVGSDYCEDADNDGIADTRGGYLKQDEYRFSSTIIDADGKKHYDKNLSRGDFIRSMETHKNATGILIFPKGSVLGDDYFPVMFASRKDGETIVARINSRQPLGEMKQFQTCKSLEIKGEPKIPTTVWDPALNTF